jgi:hypothetical protein
MNNHFVQFMDLSFIFDQITNSKMLIFCVGSTCCSSYHSQSTRFSREFSAQIEESPHWSKSRFSSRYCHSDDTILRIVSCTYWNSSKCTSFYLFSFFSFSNTSLRTIDSFVNFILHIFNWWLFDSLARNCKKPRSDSEASRSVGIFSRIRLLWHYWSFLTNSYSSFITNLGRRKHWSKWLNEWYLSTSKYSFFSLRIVIEESTNRINQLRMKTLNTTEKE